MRTTQEIAKEELQQDNIAEQEANEMCNVINKVLKKTDTTSDKSL